MSTKIEYSFSTRREAELAVEHLVQEHGFERTDIFIQPQGANNSAGEEISGNDDRANLAKDVFSEAGGKTS